MKPTMVLAAALSLLVAATAAPNPANATGGDRDEVQKATEGFYAALNAIFTGNVAPMKDVWSHTGDVTYMGPGGGLQVGWEQVLASWEEQVSMKLGGEVKPEEMRIVVGQELAITHNFERGENVGEQGEPKPVSIRATNVFRKEDGRWKMVGHHTDLLPFIARGEGRKTPE